jgi:hypothetical protein
VAESKSNGRRRKRSSSSKSSSSGSSKSSSSGSRKSSSRSNSSPSPAEVVQGAKENLEELLGRPVEAVLGMEKDGNEWTVAVEVVELRRIPPTTDVLGKYEVTLDKDGEVTSAKRVRRYHRAEAGED